ncbi:uncharacterized protein LOC142167099 [Nicotiana tabacum]|uniref:Uncharacterized protein LOC142167099 n=1 Tax=Nicotiana tabacum TaxID=4097 RepID=A0AC58SEG3_TOBAC
MIISSWNIRGINKPYKQKELKAFLFKNKITVLGCLETKVKTWNAKKVRIKIGNDWEVFANYTHAPNGKIWILWKTQHVKVKVILAGAQLVHCEVRDKHSDVTCCLTFVYGYNTIEKRQEIWTQLRQIHSNMVEVWLVLGDFNTMISVSDRINGNPISQTEVEDFQKCIADNGLGQLNRKGCQWSWCNKREDADIIYSNIDWALGNSYWFMKYSSIEAVYENYEDEEFNQMV